MFILLQAATTAAVPVTNTALTDTINALSSQATLAAITVWLLQKAKESKLEIFSGINANSKTVTSIISTVAALLSALYVQISISGDAAHGWTGTFVIPSAHVLWDSIVHFTGQKLGQEALYDYLYRKPVEVTPVTKPSMDTTGKPADVPKIPPYRPMYKL